MTGEDSTPGRRPAERTPTGPADARDRSWQRWQGADEASRAMANILAGPLVWGGVGWLADHWLGTAPWLLSIGIMSGFAGGLYLVWLRAKSPAGSAPARDGADEDDGAEGRTNVPPTRRRRAGDTGGWLHE